MTGWRRIAIAVAMTGMVPAAALAGHGKAGLWEITTQMAMANMPRIPPEQLARLKAMGLHMPTGTAITIRHCMTAEEVASDRMPDLQHNKDCTVQNIGVSAGAFHADMVCAGDEMQGSGHIAVSYDSETHFVGKVSFEGTAHGHPASMTNEMEGTWVSADCGSVAH